MRTGSQPDLPGLGSRYSSATHCISLPLAITPSSRFWATTVRWFISRPSSMASRSSITLPADPTLPCLELPFLHHTEFLLWPIVVFGVLWAVSLFGYNLPKNVAPLLLRGARYGT